MNQDDVFNNNQGIQSSMNLVENLSGGRDPRMATVGKPGVI